MPAQGAYQWAANLVVFGWYVEFTASGNSHCHFSQMVSSDNRQQSLSLLNFTISAAQVF